MSRMIRRILCSLAVVLAAHAPVRAQSDTATVLELVPPSGGAIRIGAEEWGRLPHDTIRVPKTPAGGHAPAAGAYSGVAMRTLLTRMGVPEGAAIRGEALRLYVVAEASDGYRVLFSLAELDPAFSDTPVLVADRKDGAALDAHDGPVRILAPGDKRPTRWVRNLIRITVQRAP